MASSIYTRNGDNGETGTATGQRLPKDDSLFHAGGGLDELSAQFSLLILLLKREEFQQRELFVTQLEQLLQLLFKAGSDISQQTPTPTIRDTDITWLETAIDDMNRDLPPLRDFLIPGGSILLARTAICRTVARRVERDTITAVREHTLPGVLVQLLNRLSDYLFTLERFLRLQSDLPAQTYGSSKTDKESNRDE
jgi:cob(I)alamin adenosyltransferase